MARQRFIWPTIWKDPVFGRLPYHEQVLFIGLFSIADDEGRLLADPAYLRSELFVYKAFSERKMTALRDSLVAKCANVHLYEVGGIEYLALLKWADYQRPQYPKPSRILPPVFLEPSVNDDGSVEEASRVGWVGLDRDGLDRALPVKGTLPESGSEDGRKALESINEKLRGTA